LTGGHRPNQRHGWSEGKTKLNEVCRRPRAVGTLVTNTPCDDLYISSARRLQTIQHIHSLLVIVSTIPAPNRATKLHRKSGSLSPLRRRRATNWALKGDKKIGSVSWRCTPEVPGRSPCNQVGFSRHALLFPLFASIACTTRSATYYRWSCSREKHA
jgi:hypothetical protein